MKRLLLIIILLSLSLLSFSQRNSPYPIILVHGWTGSDSSWGRTLEALKNNNLNISISNFRGEDFNEVGAGSGSRLDFNLNADNNRYYSSLSNDLYYYENYLDYNNDVFVINFYDRNSFYSNQSAAVKQGNAIGIAIQKVLNITGADKVILFGHSMGGLAIREYLQNPQHWKFTNHKVAKFITTGTPHRGSQLGSQGLNLSGKDEKTDAVRDLRASYYTGYSGVYLFGGYESKSYMDILLGDYDNLDVNCNGYSGDRIVGLNQKDIYTSPEFVSVIGTWFGSGTDNVVLSSSANMNKIGYGTLGKEFYIDMVV